MKFEDRFGTDGDPIYSIPVAVNQVACSAQGLLFVTGGILSPIYNCAICVYYFYVIKFNYVYSDAKIKKKVEPFLHAVPWAWASFAAFYALARKFLNPNHLPAILKVLPLIAQQVMESSAKEAATRIFFSMRSPDSYSVGAGEENEKVWSSRCGSLGWSRK